MSAPEIVLVNRKFSELIHPVQGRDGFLLWRCVLRIDPKTGKSEVCEHGMQAQWKNFSSDAGEEKK